MLIREATAEDLDLIWPIFHAVVSTGDTYALDADTTRDQARVLWLEIPHKTFIVEEDVLAPGTYALKANAAGGGAHVCNCGYMVAPEARGRGLATRMCLHSQEVALALGYKAMQFNLVVSTNTGALRLWKKLGFSVAGRLPKAFDHPTEGYVDAFVMIKWLAGPQKSA